MESAELGIAEELPLKRHPGLSRGAAMGPNEVLKIQEDGLEDPGHGNAVEAQPHHVPRLDRRVEEDVVVEGIAAEGKEDLVPPAPVGGGRRIEEDEDQSLDVLDTSSLEEKLGDHGIGRVGPGSRTRGQSLVRRSGGVLGEGDDGLLAGGVNDGVLCLGDTASESIGRGALALPSESSRANPLLSRRSLGLGGEEGRGESGVGRSSSGDEGRHPAEGGGGERRVHGGHTQPVPGRRDNGRAPCSRGHGGCSSGGGGSARASTHPPPPPPPAAAAAAPPRPDREEEQRGRAEAAADPRPQGRAEAAARPRQPQGWRWAAKGHACRERGGEGREGREGRGRRRPASHGGGGRWEGERERLT